jgi:hypothetical protein
VYERTETEHNPALGKDDHDTCKSHLSDLDKDLAHIQTHGVVTADGKSYRVTIIHVYDLAAFWEITGMDKFHCPYCYDRYADPKDQNREEWEREFCFAALFCHSPEHFIICILHLKLRMVDLLMELLVDRLLIEPEGVAPLEEKMVQLNIPFEIYETDTGLVRVRGYNGNEAASVLKQVKEIVSVWPPFLCPCYDELRDDTLLAKASTANVPTTKTIFKEKALKKGELVELLLESNTSKSVTALKAMLVDELKKLATEKNLKCTKQAGVEKSRSRSEIEADMKKAFIAEKRLSAAETDTEIAKRLWGNISSMIEALENKEDKDDPTLAKWLELALKVCEDWLELHRTSVMRIYLHILIAHGKTLHNKWGALGKYSQQGVEAAHKTQTSLWQQHTPRGGGRTKKSENPTTLEEKKKLKFQKMVHSYALVLLDPFMKLELARK